MNTLINKLIFFDSKSYLFIPLLLFVSISISSQSKGDLNNEYLQSLPESVRIQMLKASGEQDIEKAQLKQDPNTRMDTMKAAIVDLKKKLEDLETLTYLENNNDSKLGFFGDTFFSSYQTSFSPINEQNIHPNYILGPGDIINLTLFGGDIFPETKKLKVNRDGSILIDGLGALRLAGLRFDQVNELVEEFVSTKRPGTSAYVSFDQLRDIQVLLVGSDKKNGIYTLPGGSSILTLLHAVSGPGADRSFRKILHKREGKLIEEVDLYDILIFGDFNFKNSLQSGDTVMLEPVQKRVGVAGGVGVQSIYELKKDETIIDLIQFAKGFKDTQQTNISIISQDSNISEIAFKNLDDLDQPLRNGDLVTIPYFDPIVKDEFKVKIHGAVNSPGTYSSPKPLMLSELIEMAGGYSVDSYPFGGELRREKVAIIQQDAIDRSYNELITFMASAGSSSSLSGAASSNLEFILTQIKSVKPSGRVTADFLVDSGDNFIDTILVNGDEIYIPYFSSEVSILGEIQSSGTLPFREGISANEYIDMSGGFSRFADTDRVVVIGPDGSAFRLKKQFILSDSIEIYPGSIIYVPRDIGKIDGISFAATIAPIFSSLALSLASLNSIK